MASENLAVGYKVEIKYLPGSVATEINVDIKHAYKSQIYDIKGENDLILLMPIESGRVVVLHKDIRYELCFYTKTGLFKSMGVVTERYKDGKIFVVRIVLKAPLTKYQRREYFRAECLIELNYKQIKENVEFDFTNQEKFMSMYEKKFPEEVYKNGVIVDISGGGMRTRLQEIIPNDSYIILKFYLIDKGIKKEYEIIGRVVSSEKILKPDNIIFEARIEYINMSEEKREEIIKYIFEEERRKRQKTIG